MESYDVFLIGNFLALDAFTKRYGLLNEGTGKYGMSLLQPAARNHLVRP